MEIDTFPMNDRNHQEQTSLTSRLRSVGRAEHFWHLASGMTTTVLVGSALLLLCVLLESVLHGSIVVRSILWWTVIGGTIGTAAWTLWRPALTLLGLLPSPSIHHLALRVGDAYPDVRDTLSNALQLASAVRAGGSPELADAAFERSAEAARDKDFSVIIDRKRMSRSILLFLALSLVTPALVLSPLLNAPFHRLVEHDTSFLPPAPFSLNVRVSADTVMRGEGAHVEIFVEGTRPREVTLWIREGHAERFTPMPVEIDAKKPTIYQLPGLKSDVYVYVEAPWNETSVRSDTVHITVIDRPLVRTLNGRVTPPAYTMLPPVLINEQQADVTALKGSTVDLQISSNKKLTEASIIVEQVVDTTRVDTTIIAMKVNDHAASASFRVTGNGSYSIHVRDVDGQDNAEPVRYGIVALTDGYPTIAMIQPTKDVDVDQEARLPITAAIADDYGFSRLTLKYRLLRSRYARPEERYQDISIPIDTKQTTLDIGYTWDLAKIDITPDDVYEFYLEVADNDVVNGPKTARTTAFTVRLPSLEELYADADKVQSQVQKELEQLLKESEQVRKEADELQRELQKQQAQSKQQTQWNEKKKAEDLAKKQEQLQQRMEDAAQKLEEMTERLQQNQAISEETLKKYQELQELMKKVRSPELERMQQQMKEAMEKMSPEQLERMMKEFKFDEEQFKKNIERTMNLLKRIQAEQKTEELAKRAEELARRQDELRKRAENTNANDQKSRDRLAKEQEQLEKDLKELARDAKDLEDMMKDLGADMPTDMMENAREELDADKTAQDMQKAQKQMQQGDMQSASEKQKQASRNMQRFAQQMQQMQKQMRKNANKENMRQMQQGMQDLSDLSKQQEELMQAMQNMDPSSAQFAQAAQRQKQIQQSMQNIANSMFQLSQRSTSVSPELAQDLGNALEQMQNAMQQMQERNGAMSQRGQQAAMGSMNSAAQKMGNALGQMMRGDASGQGGQGQQPGQGQGGQSPFQRLQQLADQQQSINEGMNQMGQGAGGGSGGRMSEQQRAEMGRLAAQQGKALKALQELDEERRNHGGTKKPIGDLQQIAEDMKEVMSDMQTGSITPETRMRQERILSRLLNASRSMNERDYEKTRESRSGQDIRRSSPADLPMTDDARSMRDIMNELRKGYTKDYENLIRSYFEELQKRRLKLQEEQ
jgi:hypothetical protein